MIALDPLAPSLIDEQDRVAQTALEGLMSQDLPFAASSYSPGVRVGGYLLEEQIGHGGMAVVFRAHDEKLDRRVALKILAPALAADEAFRHRFIRESRAAAAVDDPHIIPVFEAGEADGALFIAMRYVPAGDLRSLVFREGPLDQDRVAAIISPVASALDAAHAAGLIHRDVKPANILLDARPGRPDHVYLSDFGLSKAAAGSAGLTATGLFLGTVDYASPEQVGSGAVDGRADQYALACTAFEMLCGEPPFSRDHALAVMHAHLSTPPPRVSVLRPGLPAAADAVLDRALAKSPEDRYRTCGEFSDALRGALGLARYDEPASRPGRGPTELPAIAPAPGRVASGYAPTAPAGLGQPQQPQHQPVPAPAPQQALTWAPPPPRQHPDQVPPIRQHPAPGPRPRRRQAGLAIAGATVALAVIAAAATIVLLRSRSAPPTAAGHGTAGRHSPAPGRTASVTPSPAPSGWNFYRNPGRFSIYLPPGWSMSSSSDTATWFNGQEKGFVIKVAWTSHPKPDALKDWRQQARAMPAQYPSYRQIYIRSVSYRGYNAADWEFDDVINGRPRQHLDRGFIVDPGRLAFAIELSGPPARWQAVYASIWHGLVTSFKPA
jgi:serine/threonine protein kinase